MSHNKIILVIHILRPYISSIAGLLSFSLVFIHSDTIFISKYSDAIISFIALTTLTMGGFSINDVLDYKKDKKSGRSDKPISDGRLSRALGVKVTIVCFILSFISSGIFGLNTFIISVFWAFILSLYPIFSARFPAAKGAYTATLVLSPVIWGWAATDYFPGFLVCLTIFLFIWGREILIDTNEMIGDKKANLRTIPVIFGAGLGHKVAWAFMFMSLLPISLAAQSPFDTYAILVISISLCTIRALKMTLSQAIAWTRLPMLVSIILIV